MQVIVMPNVTYELSQTKEYGCVIKMSGSESRGQEEAACIRVFRPMRPLQ